jgi:hypothetical protein
VKHLVQRLEELHEKYRGLVQSYTDETDKVTNLKTRVAELSNELLMARNCQTYSEKSRISNNSADVDQFDAFSMASSSSQPDETWYLPGDQDPALNLFGNTIDQL